MKKKVFGLIMALVMIVGLLPFSALAAEPIKVRVSQVDGPEAGSALDFRKDWDLMPGDVKYIVSDENVISVWGETEAPEDNFVKFEVPAEGGRLDVTMKNFQSIDAKKSDWTSAGIWFRAGDYSVNMTLLGENSMKTASTPCIKHSANGTCTITGEGSLSLEITGDSAGAFYGMGGDVIIKDTTFNGIQSLDAFYLHHPINMVAGNLLIENSKCTFNTTGGSAIYFGTITDADTSGRYTSYAETDRKIEIKNSNIFIKQTDGGNSQGAIVCLNSIVDDDCTIEIYAARGKPFSKAPTFNGEEYTAIAGLKPATAKTYSRNKNAQYLYFKMTPGLPPETEPTTEPTTAPTEPATEPTTEPIVDATQPDATQPNATQPDATQPNATQPEATKPDATQPTDDTEDNSGNNALTIVLIVVAALVVLGGGAFAVLYILRKKNII